MAAHSISKKLTKRLEIDQQKVCHETNEAATWVASKEVAPVVQTPTHE
jgi:hypothetical protein